MKAVAPRWPRACAQLVGVVAMVAGIVVLAGRAFHISSLESVLAGWPKMVPATALGFVVFGVALWRLAQNVDYMVGWNTSLEMLGFQGTAWTTNPSRMAPATALCFFVLGVALLLAGARKFASFAEQLNAGLARRHQGTGLGLVLTKKNVGGTIGIESEPGKGSTFTVVMPRASNKKVA